MITATLGDITTFDGDAIVNDEAARIAVGEVRRAIDGGLPLERVEFVCFPQEVYEAYRRVLEEAQGAEQRDRTY